MKGTTLETLYTATSTGDGHRGHVHSEDGILDLDPALPRGMGGTGGATNPEQLFVAGYAACFHSALKLIAGRAGATVDRTTVTADVGIGPDAGGAFGLAITLQVRMPGFDRDAAAALVAEADRVCPYSNAVRGNVAVTLDTVTG